MPAAIQFTSPYLITNFLFSFVTDDWISTISMKGKMRQILALTKSLFIKFVLFEILRNYHFLAFRVDLAATLCSATSFLISF